MQTPPFRILFVCLGNICRSPAAEGIARRLASSLPVAPQLDSAGLGDWHAGEPPHSTMRRVAAERGFPIDDLRARQVVPADLNAFDWVIAMDSSNLKGLNDLHRKHGGSARIRMLCSDNVPDPYYGGLEGFYASFDMIRDGVERLFAEISAERKNG